MGKREGDDFNIEHKIIRWNPRVSHYREFTPKARSPSSMPNYVDSLLLLLLWRLCAS